MKALPLASLDLDSAVRAVLAAKRAEVAAWEWLTDVCVDVRREADGGRDLHHALLVGYWNATNAVVAAEAATGAAESAWRRATFDYRAALVVANPVTSPGAGSDASWTPDERLEWEESIAKIDGLTVVDVDDWCQAKNKPVAERAGAEGRSKMLAYFTSPSGAKNVHAYLVEQKKR